MPNLERHHLIKKENLNGASYFESLLQEAHRHGLLTTSQLQQIQLECLQIIAVQAERYTNGESSSVTVDTAHRLMQSILYTIGVYLKALPDTHTCITFLMQVPLVELHKLGKALVREHFYGAKKQFATVVDARIITENIAYNDTLDHGIPLFFASYDADFAAHVTTGAIDYPLCNDPMNLVGIEYIESYVQKLALEHQFCSYFHARDIECLLRGYDTGYADLLVNIFSLVLTNAVGCILAGVDGTQLNIDLVDLHYLQRKLASFTKSELATALQQAAAELLSRMGISDGPIWEYGFTYMQDLIVRVKNALDNDQLGSVFVTLKEKEPRVALEFLDGKQMDDESFRRIVELLRSCGSVADKIAIINKTVSSLTDLVDLLGSYVIFADEFAAVFTALGDTELALLLHTLPNDVVDPSDHISVNEQEWHQQLHLYLASLDVARREQITELATGISLR